MPKTRSYSKEELQGLRRADLQRLCKTYDIKGANAKSEVLIDTLATFFTSPAYLSSPRPDRPRARPTAKAPLPPNRSLNPLPRRTAVKPKTDVKQAAAVPANSSLAVSTAVPMRKANEPPTAPAVAVSAVNTVSAGTALNTAQPQTSTMTDSSDLPTLRREITRLEAVITDWQKDQALVIDRLVEAKIAQHLEATIKRQMALVDEREARVKLREEQLDAAWKRLEATLAAGGQPQPSLEAPAVPSMASSSAIGEKRRLSDQDSPSRKRARTLQQSDLTSPHTPPPTVPSLEQSDGLHSTPTLAPRTPAPSTPAARASSVISGNHSAGAANEDRSAKFPTSHLPPTDPSSPTMERFDRTPQRNAPAPPPILPTAGQGFGAARSRVDLSARKALRAHMELATITDESAPGSAAPSPSFSGPILIRDGAITPPALSPSPSIGGDHVTYSLLPAASGPLSHSMLRVSSTDATAAAERYLGGRETTPPRVAPSPRREYLDVALNGLNDSSTAMATPNSRTLMGTERYRDTRFGDEPFVAWTSPTLDCGSSTPTHN